MQLSEWGLDAFMRLGQPNELYRPLKGAFCRFSFLEFLAADEGGFSLRLPVLNSGSQAACWRPYFLPRKSA